MSERPTRYAARGRRVDGSDPAALAASLAFQAPPAAPMPEAPADPLAPDRLALVRHILAYPGDWRRVALLVLESRGPDALADESLATVAALLDGLEHRSAP